jgi:hypothetical protein
MKTQTIEVDADTATALKQRTAERGVSVPELPRLGRPIAGRDEYRQLVLQVAGAATSFNIASMVSIW